MDDWPKQRLFAQASSIDSQTIRQRLRNKKVLLKLAQGCPNGGDLPEMNSELSAGGRPGVSDAKLNGGEQTDPQIAPTCI